MQPILRKLLLLLLIVTIYSCTQSTPKEEIKISKKISTTEKITKSDSIIDFPCAVLIYPSSKKIDIMKKTDSEDDFYTAADDNQYYMAQCIHFLDSVKTKRLIRESEGIASFKTLAGKTYKLKLDSMYWGVLLFNGKNKPIVADITWIDNDYKSYMK